jgi:hypothetical protein
MSEYFNVMLSKEQAQSLLDALDTLDANKLTAITDDLDKLSEARTAVEDALDEAAS